MAMAFYIAMGTIFKILKSALTEIVQDRLAQPLDATESSNDSTRMYVSKDWRTFITALSEEGVSVRVMQELARHRDLATTQPYIDVSVDKLRKAVNLVGI
jgi:site-specific recombinase XerD